MKHVLTLSLILLFALTSLYADDVAGKGKTYGKGVALKDTVSVSSLLSDPDTFVGKKVKVKGQIVGVCKHRGCWISIAGKNDYESIRIKVVDGEIVFPPESLGKTATAEGVFEILKPASACPANCAHKADGKKHAHEESKADLVVQIKGTGAVIYQ